MSLTTAVSIIVLLDVALIATLAYVMSMAGRLTPHVPAGAPAPTPAAASRVRERAAAPLAPEPAMA